MANNIIISLFFCAIVLIFKVGLSEMFTSDAETKKFSENKAQWPSFLTSAFENFKNLIADVVNVGL